MRIRICVAGLVAVLVSLGDVHAIGQVKPQNVTVALSAKPSVVLGEPVVVDVTIQNRLSEPVDLNLGASFKEGISIAVTGPDGVTRNLHRFVPDGFLAVGAIGLSAGDVFEQQYVLDEWRPFTAEGRYRVEIALVGIGLRIRNGVSLAPPPAERLDVTVEPPDATRVRESCERFADRAISPTSAQARLDAGNALAHFTDPAVVPCLERVSRAGTVLDGFIIPALGRIGTPEAEAVLLELAKSTAWVRPQMAQDQLRRLRSRTN